MKKLEWFAQSPGITQTCDERSVVLVDAAQPFSVRTTGHLEIDVICSGWFRFVKLLAVQCKLPWNKGSDCAGVPHRSAMCFVNLVRQTHGNTQMAQASEQSPWACMMTFTEETEEETEYREERGPQSQPMYYVVGAHTPTYLTYHTHIPH